MVLREMRFFSKEKFSSHLIGKRSFWRSTVQRCWSSMTSKSSARLIWLIVASLIASNQCYSVLLSWPGHLDAVAGVRLIQLTYASEEVCQEMRNTFVFIRFLLGDLGWYLPEEKSLFVHRHPLLVDPVNAPRSSAPRVNLFINREKDHSYRRHCFLQAFSHLRWRASAIDKDQRTADPGEETSDRCNGVSTAPNLRRRYRKIGWYLVGTHQVLRCSACTFPFDGKCVLARKRPGSTIFHL